MLTCPGRAAPHEADSDHSAEDLADIVRMTAFGAGLEQSDEQIKDQPGLGRLPGPLRSRLGGYDQRSLIVFVISFRDFVGSSASAISRSKARLYSRVSASSST